MTQLNILSQISGQSGSMPLSVPRSVPTSSLPNLKSVKLEKSSLVNLETRQHFLMKSFHNTCERTTNSVRASWYNSQTLNHLNSQRKVVALFLVVFLTVCVIDMPLNGDKKFS